MLRTTSSMPMRVSRLFIPSIALAITAGCASTSVVPCPTGEQPVVLDSLYFGAAKSGGVVTAEDWMGFLNDIVVPNFPEGLTSWSAAGRWRNSAGLVEHETSYVLQLAHHGSEERDLAVQRIIHRYKRDFQQESVMRIRSRACRSF